jgi:hypothetical protein
LDEVCCEPHGGDLPRTLREVQEGGMGPGVKSCARVCLLEGDKAEILQDFIAPFLASSRTSTAFSDGHEA